MLLVLLGGAAAEAAPWLFITDIHLKANFRTFDPSPLGDDTDQKLFDTALREMQRIDPHPPVVVVTGDLLAHVIDRRQAAPTTALIARRLGRAFPDAQFVLALGNNDGSCGDYGLSPESSSLREIARDWAPLVNRHGAAPAFIRTFVHDGFYTARLPGRNLHAIVIDDVVWSPRYHAGCGPLGNVKARVIGQLDDALRTTPGHVWVLFHIPPGVDAFSTAHLVHDLAIIPFLDPSPRERLTELLARTPGKVALVVAGHTHKFAYRIIDAAGPRPVPMLLVPSVSPIFVNAASFLTGTVTPEGTVSDLQEYSYLARHWIHVGGMRDIGVDAFTGPQLVALNARLMHDAKARATFERLYEGGVHSEIDDRNWPIYHCAATAFSSSAFSACTGAGGLSVITRRGLKVVLVIAAVAIVVIAVGVMGWLRLRRRALRT